MAKYSVENQWGGTDAPWNPGGEWVLGNRPGQHPIEFDISSDDGGKTLTGTMTYAGEGPIGFKATLDSGNSYKVENQWGGPEQPWHDGGTFVIGGRDDQHVVRLQVASHDGGTTFMNHTGMTYDGEGPIGFKAHIEN